MIIIVEGPDFSGKTTLCQQLVKDLNAELVKSVRPRYLENIYAWSAKVSVIPNEFVVCDRSPLISEMIYGPILRGETLIDQEDCDQTLDYLEAFIIFCDPGEDVVLSCNNDQMDGVKENLDQIYGAYQVQLNPDVVNFHYDFNNSADYPDLLHLIKKADAFSAFPLLAHLDYEMELVQSFNEKFEIPTPPFVRLLEGDVLEFRSKFLQEELNEFIEAHDQGDLVHVFDALLDLVYVAKGTALLLGIAPEQWAAGFAAVQKANMNKMRAPSANHSKRRHSLDVIKPAGWIGPEAELKRILDR